MQILAGVTAAPLITVGYLVVGGGGSGARAGGGGGAGGLRSTVTSSGGTPGTVETALALLPSTNYSVSIGSGGAPDSNGSPTVFSTITSTGGGNGVESGTGSNGGSGGGGSDTAGAGGTGNANEGFDGGTGNRGNAGTCRTGGGGGGSGGLGGAASGTVGGASGLGLNNSVTGSSVAYAGGGVGGADDRFGGTFPSPSLGGTAANSNGAANTGAGGGGRGITVNQNGNGGSGVVILRYLTAAGTITIGAGLTGSSTPDGSYQVTTITAGIGNVSWA